MYCTCLLSSTTKIICSHSRHAARMLYSRSHREQMDRYEKSFNEIWYTPPTLCCHAIYPRRRRQLTLDIASLHPPLSHARRTFNSIYNTDIYIWNSLIRHYAHSDQNTASNLDVDQEFETCVSTTKPDTYTHENLPRALENLVVARDVEKGHCIAIKCGVDSLNFVENALVRFYGACGEAYSALRILKLMPERNLVAWNSVLIGHVINVINKKHDIDSRRVLVLCRVMLLDGFKPDEFTLVSALTADAQDPWLKFAMRAHGYVYKVGLDKNLHSANALLYYYAKCGPPDSALRLFFLEMEEKNVVSWNSMIVGMCVNTFTRKALKLFEQFEREGLVPNEFTLAGVLLACLREGLVKKGLEYFERMTNEWGIEPIIENYTCMVELLAPCKPSAEIVEFLQKMPVKPNIVFWSILSKVRLDVFFGLPMRKRERDGLVKMIKEFEKSDESGYYLLS